MRNEVLMRTRDCKQGDFNQMWLAYWLSSWVTNVTGLSEKEFSMSASYDGDETTIKNTLLWHGWVLLFLKLGTTATAIATVVTATQSVINEDCDSDSDNVDTAGLSVFSISLALNLMAFGLATYRYNKKLITEFKEGNQSMTMEWSTWSWQARGVPFLLVQLIGVGAGAAIGFSGFFGDHSKETSLALKATGIFVATYIGNANVDVIKAMRVNL